MSDNLKLITDHKWRPFRFDYDVPPRILAKDFNYQNRDEARDGFFKYRRRWYHLDQFVDAGPDLPLARFDGLLSDTFFSGVAIKLATHGETYRVARFYR